MLDYKDIITKHYNLKTGVIKNTKVNILARRIHPGRRNLPGVHEEAEENEASDSG